MFHCAIIAASFPQSPANIEASDLMTQPRRHPRGPAGSETRPDPSACALCGHPLTAFCPRCRGAAGGRRKSARKTRTSARNGRRGGRVRDRSG